MTRLAINHHAPEGCRATLQLDAYVRRQLDAELLDLVKLRASQLNGCAFCVDMHASDLEQLGVAARKIYAVSTWSETSFFTDRERAALALTQQITHLADGVDEPSWQAAAAEFSDRELSDLVLAIDTINLQNRIGVSTRMSPPPVEG